MQIEVFQEYQDTVIAVGLSHLPRNSKIFSSADLSVGVDILTECIPSNMPDRPNRNTILPSEIAFVSAISSHQCAFRVKGISATAYLPTIIAQGRASLEAATSATMYMVSGCLSFSFYVLFCTFTVGTVVPFVPLIGSVMILQVILPIVGLTIAMGDLAPGSMKRVPPKNDQSVVFGRKEGKAIYQTALLKALPPAALPQLLYLIIFGEFIIEMEPDLATACSESIGKGDWTQIVRCEGLKDYTGPARISAGALSLAELALCVVVASAAFVYRTEPMLENSPFRRNHIWCYSLVVSVFIIGGFVGASLEPGLFWSLPWYYYIMAVFLPFLCLAWDEFWKRTERSHYNRAEKLRRLQFETRLGMWSPK
jgi:magnesium-transporting ATPase (P-type)